MNGLREWKCGNGHVIGLITGNGISNLLLFRWAVEVGGTEDEAIDVMAVVEGKVVDVRCSICGDVRSWFPDAKVMKRMMRRRAT